MWLPDGEKNLKICLFVLTQCTNVTNTHRHIDRHHITAKAALAAEAHPQGGLGGPDPPVFEQRGPGGVQIFCTEAVVCIFTVSVR